MTREHKLALIIGFAVVLLVGVLVSDHFSQARRDRAGLDLTAGQPASFGAAAPVLVSPVGVGVGVGVGSGIGGGVGQVDRGVAGEGASGEQGGRMTASSLLTRETVESAHRPVEIKMGGASSSASMASSMNSTGGGVGGGGRVSDPAAAFGSGGWSGGSGTGGDGVRLASDPLGGAGVVVRGGGASGVATPRRHEVQDRETLSQIARRYYGRDSAWREIAKANPGRVDAEGNVRSGVTLIIPALDGMTPVREGDGVRVAGVAGGGGVGSASQATRSAGGGGAAAASSSSATATTAAAGGNAGSAGDGVRYHTVQRGEVLGTISQNLLGTSRRYREIVALNSDVIRDPDHVPAGTRLRIPAR